MLQSTHLVSRESRNQGTRLLPTRASSQATATAPRRVVPEKEIDTYVQQIIETISPSQSELDNKKEKCRALETIIRRILPNARLNIMGGIANTFALKNSDVDACIVNSYQIRDISQVEIQELNAAFRKAGIIICCIHVDELNRIYHRTPFAHICSAPQGFRQLVYMVKSRPDRIELE
jgi:hypothetical protein